MTNRDDLGQLIAMRKQLTTLVRHGWREDLGQNILFAPRKFKEFGKGVR